MIGNDLIEPVHRLAQEGLTSFFLFLLHSRNRTGQLGFSQDSYRWGGRECEKGLWSCG